MDKDPKYLLEEQELIIAQAPHWTARLLRAFPAFRHHNYRLFFIGQFTSLIGTWMHTVALGWLVLTLTNSAFWVSFVSALDSFPILFLSLPAGILADRFEKRRIIVITHIFSMGFAFLLALSIQTHVITLALLISLTLLIGAAHAVEMPTRQAFVFDVVGKRDIASAVAMNVGMFNSARVISPALAGTLISLFNIQVAFFLNGISFLAVIFVLLKMRTKTFITSSEHTHPLTQLKEGIAFAATHPIIRTLLFIVAFNSMIPWSYNSIMPVVAKEIFHVGSEGFGMLLSAAGLGALCGAIFISSRTEKLHVAKAIAIGSSTIGISLVLFSVIGNIYVALPILFVIGFSLVAQISLSNATIQQASPNHIRGRVMSVYSLMFLGMMPFGSVLMGTLASMLGVQIAMRLFGIITLFGALYYIFFLKSRLETLPK